LNANKISLSKEDLIKVYGEPDTIMPGRMVTKANANRTGKENSVSYDNYVFGDMKFAVFGDKAQLEFV
jgi:hypothetical protein